MFVSMLLHASNDTLFLFLAFLLVPVSPIIILTTEPENTNPATTTGVTVICSVISYPQLEERSLVLTDNEINSNSDINILWSNTIRVSVVVLVSHVLFLLGVGVTFVTKSYRKILSTWSSVTDES